MISILAVSIAMQTGPDPFLRFEPVLRLMLDGSVYMKGGSDDIRVRPGTSVVSVPGGTGWEFNGKQGGIELGDAAALKLTGSMSVAVWLYVRSYVGPGPGSQILFRGDDRNGLDPYSLVVHPDGTVNFGLQDERNDGASVTARVPLNGWRHVVASFDSVNGSMKLYLNGALQDARVTTVRPFRDLDRNWAPGVSIGNVPNRFGPHNQPLNGIIADLAVFARVVTPADLRVGYAAWSQMIE